MIRKKTGKLLFILLAILMCVPVVSCNSKSSDDESEIAVTPAMVAVKKFSLNANSKVLENLDSVFFSIDLNTGVIFNADSLPKGTDVSKLVASITFANTMTRAELSFLKDNSEKTTVNYLTNPEDTIDFTSPVTLDVTAEDGLTTFSYTIKVNIHTQNPDTILWAGLSSSDFPSIYGNPVAQKTLTRDSVVYCMIEEHDGSYTLANSKNLESGDWDKTVLNLAFAPDLSSFTASESRFWILDFEGHLYSSETGAVWLNTGETWVSITGGYADSILGIKRVEEQLYHSRYPTSAGYTETMIEDEFPIYHASILGVVETDWAPDPFAILACGVTSAGELSSNVWAYDGVNWAIINDTDLPALEYPMMARYIVYRETPQAFKERAFDVWLLMGGMTSGSEMSREIYMSYDNGVHWSKVPESMQFPSVFPSLAGSDLVVVDSTLTADLSSAWTLISDTKSAPTRSSYKIIGYDIFWQCPYLYIFGGYSPENQLSETIWRGVLARLEFTPDI